MSSLEGGLLQVSDVRVSFCVTVPVASVCTELKGVEWGGRHAGVCTVLE